MICIEPQKKVPVLATCEVLVVGGGPAGLSAALGARRAGADVILCEAYGCFGGVITQVEMVYVSLIILIMIDLRKVSALIFD